MVLIARGKVQATAVHRSGIVRKNSGHVAGLVLDYTQALMRLYIAMRQPSAGMLAVETRTSSLMSDRLGYSPLTVAPVGVSRLASRLPPGREGRNASHTGSSCVCVSITA